jgi:chorismate synthase
MGSNSFGNIFRFTTWGESHGPALGVVIDGCPAGLLLSETDFLPDLKRRAPGQSSLTSPRNEPDLPKILSGVFDGKTTGAPISILIENRDVRSSDYTAVQQLLRPGHANFTYLAKYGCFDHRGGGRASGRETVCRVAAGVIAKKLLALYAIEVTAYISQIGAVMATELSDLRQRDESPVYCPDRAATELMCAELQKVKAEGDSLGGVVSFIANNVPPGLGDPVYEKLDARLAFALLSIPATKGFEIGSGFSGCQQKGSEHSDSFTKEGEKIITATNFAGGILGGISTGMPITGRVAFKPTSSVTKPLSTLTLEGEKAEFEMPKTARTDPCIALRGVVVVEAMTAVVLADALLMNRFSKCAML